MCIYIYMYIAGLQLQPGERGPGQYMIQIAIIMMITINIITNIIV